MQVDQVAEGRRLGLAALQGRLAKIDPALSRGGPPAPVLAPQEGLARVRLFASDLHPPVARLEPGKGGHFVCATCAASRRRSEEHTSELQSLMRISYAVFCLKKTKQPIYTQHTATSE